MPPAKPIDPTPIDAREFGRHVNQGGWRLGLLVARNVRLAAPGRPRAATAGTPEAGKLTPADFARLAGVSRATVGYYLVAWNYAADAGVVPHSTALSLGAAPPVPNGEDAPTKWSTFYRRARTPATTGPTAGPPAATSSSASPASPASTRPSTPVRTEPEHIFTSLSRVLDGYVRASNGLADILDALEGLRAEGKLDELVTRNPITVPQLATKIESLADSLPTQFARLGQLAATFDREPEPEPDPT